MTRDLSRSLHALTARLVRGADAILRAEVGLSYARFVALYMVGSEGADTQRVLAQRLGVSEPSVSRMVRALVQAGLLQMTADPAGGNRNQLRLTAVAEQLVQRWGAELEERLAALLRTTGVPYRTYVGHTKRLLAALEAPEAATSARDTAAVGVPGSTRG